MEIIILILIVYFITKAKKKNHSSSRPKAIPKQQQEPERTLVQPSAPYRSDRIAALRHEEWMPVPPGSHIITCGYCGAENTVPNNSRIKYTCYFCREEL